MAGSTVLTLVRLNPRVAYEAEQLGVDVAMVAKKALVEAPKMKLLYPRLENKKDRARMRVRIPRPVWEELRRRFGSVSLISWVVDMELSACVMQMKILLATPDNELLALVFRHQPPNEDQNTVVEVRLPKPVVETAQEAGVHVGAVVKAALIAFARKRLPPTAPILRPDVEKVRIFARVPEEVADYLGSIGGPSRAWWFCCRVLLTCAKKLREVREDAL